MDNYTAKLTLSEYLTPLNHNFLSDLIQELDLDRYVKKLDTVAASKLLIYGQLMQVQTITDISLQLKNQKQLQKIVGLSSISTSQLSRKWRNLDHTFLEQVYRHVVRQVISKFGIAQANKKLGKVHLVDASTITLCLNLYRWATYSKHKSAVKLHVRFNHTADIGYPDEVLLTTGEVGDRSLMDDLVVLEPDALNVFDRAYVDYRKYDDYCEKSVRFVTRLRSSADFKVLETRKVNSEAGILRDDIIWLGYRGKKYRMKSHLRLIEGKDQEDKPLLICTNDFEMTADQIREIYRRRWKIEMFFKWIKQHLHVKSFYGTSPNAVYNQIYAALITFCLSLLMQANVHHRGTLWELVKQLKWSWDQLFHQFLKALFAPPGRTSRGRRRQIDVAKDFTEICRQFENEETAYWDEYT
jgi:transposase